MMRIVAATSFALFAMGLTISAQESTVKSTTKISGDRGREVTYTGCVGAGTETRTYVLNKVVPVTRTRETEGTTGTTTETQTGYLLVPDQTVQVQEHLGHKVQVTGILMPGGDSKTERRTKIEREGEKDTTVKEKTKSDNALPRFQVTSIRDLNERCE